MSVFNLSFDPYIRLRTETGGRVSNRRLDNSDDSLVWECVNYYEREQERCFAHMAKMQADRLRKE